MSTYTQLWLVWIALFVTIEGTALLSKIPGASLTAHIIEWAALRNKTTGWLLRRGALVTFFGWLIWHFASRTNF
jgi:hypothetical protein